MTACKQYRYLVIVLLLGCTLWGCAQPKASMTGTTIHVYYWQRLPGTIAIDPETGKEQVAKTDTVWLVYAETIKDDITWLYAWKNGVVYKLSSQPVAQNVTIGTDKRTGEEVKLTIGSGKFVQQLQLLAANEKVTLRPPVNSTGIWLVGEYKGKQLLQPAGEAVEITLSQLPQ